MKLGIPQMIMLSIYLLSLGAALAKNGKEKVSKVSFGENFFVVAVYTGLLYWGGFF